MCGLIQDKSGKLITKGWREKENVIDENGEKVNSNQLTALKRRTVKIQQINAFRSFIICGIGMINISMSSGDRVNARKRIVRHVN